MELGLVTIQRNRAPWLLEWFAFHYLIGFRTFYFYAHLCTDDTVVLLAKLTGKFNVHIFTLDHQSDVIQLDAYRHACANYINDVDWMCFLDGDEFIFPTAASTMQDALAQFDQANISAIGVYNYNFGSAGHLAEPSGLITENFRMRAHDQFMPHRRVKSIVKGRQPVSPSACSNVFNTPLGTVDELMRPILWGYVPQYEPSYTQFRFNHYVCQSFEYYSSFKKHSGFADASASAVREDEWWENFNTNAVMDDSLLRFSDRLKALVDELNDFIRA